MAGEAAAAAPSMCELGRQPLVEAVGGQQHGPLHMLQPRPQLPQLLLLGLRTELSLQQLEAASKQPQQPEQAHLQAALAQVALSVALLHVWGASAEADAKLCAGLQELGLLPPHFGLQYDGQRQQPAEQAAAGEPQQLSVLVQPAAVCATGAVVACLPGAIARQPSLAPGAPGPGPLAQLLRLPPLLRDSSALLAAQLLQLVALSRALMAAHSTRATCNSCSALITLHSLQLLDALQPLGLPHPSLGVFGQLWAPALPALLALPACAACLRCPRGLPVPPVCAPA